MSRAFVRESDFDPWPDLPPLVSPLPPGTRNFLTAGGAERLRAELAQKLTTERPTLAGAPADDTDAKRALQSLDQRIRYLQESLRTAEVPSRPELPHDVVRFGARVTVRENNGGETSYRIVGVDETDPAQNAVSWLSPIARALLNAKLGDRVQLQAPRGKRELAVVAIDYGEPG